MTLEKGVFDAKQHDEEEMFIGWAPAPGVDRRFLLGMLPLGLAGMGGLSYAIASRLDDPGAGAWNTGATHQVTGVLSNEPYPMIRMRDASAPGGVRTVLVVAQGKCTSGLLDGANTDGAVTASGVLIERKNRQMLEVPPLLGDWIEPAILADAPPAPAPQSLGRVALTGSIMDSKCFFGVMRPGRGKTHKACATLCIRGGIPPSFWARDDAGNEAVLLMTTANGDAMPMDILPLVADPVRAAGELVRVGDIIQFRADPGAYSRI